MGGYGKAAWAHLPLESPDAVRDLAKRLANAGFDAIIPCLVSPDGSAIYQSRVARVDPAIAGWDPLEVLCDEAGQAGLEVHAWNCVFAEGAQSQLFADHPRTVARFRDGEPEFDAVAGGSSWACPAQAATQAYELAIYQEWLDRYEVALHIDYIRYKDDTICFCPHCRAAFMQHYGSDPVEIDGAHEHWTQWVDWRAAQITGFVEQLRERSIAAGRTISAGVFADYPECIETVGQDWEDWGRRDLVDVMMPMNYTPSASIAAKRTRNHVHALGGSVPLWEGLLLRDATTTAELVAQVEAVLEAGASGIVIFEYSGRFGRALSDEDIHALNAIAV
jgi:uncharacterized lipoprotein YddW (UPF0748 family)